MIDGFTDAQVIGGLIALLLLLLGAFFAWIVRRFDRLDDSIKKLDDKLSARLDALTISVSRLEGAVYYGLPEPRRTASE